MERGTPDCARANGCLSEVGPREGSVKRREARVQGAARRSQWSVARQVGAVAAGLLVVAGMTAVFDASSTVLGSAPPGETLNCNDNWVGGGGAAGDWDSAANWSAGVPSGPDVGACITGNANVTLTDASSSIGALTVSPGSSLTIGAGTSAATPSLSISSALQNGGSLTVDATGSPGHPGLSLNGPITNSGTITVDGTVDIGGGGGLVGANATATAVQNDGTIGVAPGGLVDGDPTTTITNDPTGVLAFGIAGPPGTPTAYGRITGSTLALGGTADPVYEDGFTPPSGAEYVVGDGPSTGTFATVSGGATADYSQADQLGLIGGAPATLTVTHVTSSVPAGSLFGQPVGLTAVVTPTTGTGPTGSVSFFAGALPLGSSPVTTSPSGVTSATVSTAQLPAPSATITAAYSGDVLFGPSTSTPLTQVVHPDPTTLTITPSVPSPEAGQPVTDTATVATTSPSSAPATGTVSFSDDGNPVPGCQSLALSEGVPSRAACTESFGSGATHAIVAIYSGDVDNAGSTATLTQTVGQLPTATAVTSSTPSTVYGQTAIVTATVMATGSAAVDPSGTVTFSDGVLPLGTVGVSDAAGTATASLDTSSLVEGVHFLTATYSGDPTYATSTTTTPFPVDVAEAPTTVTVDDASSQSVVGQTVVFTASIASPVPGTTGTVQFADDGDPIGSGAVSGGQATFETSSLALGAHAITAVYEGDDNFVGGSSRDTVTQTVGQAATATEVTSAHDPGLIGQTITYTATVAAATPGSGTPTGTASFSDGGNPIPGCQGLALSPAPPLVVTCPQAYDTTASQDVTVAYSGDANFTASSGAMTENVSPVSTTTALVPSPAASTSGQSVTLTATVSPTSGTAHPDGSVSFILNGSPLGTSVVSTTNGVSSASMLLTTLPLGSDSVTASYGGSPDFLASAADATSVVVTKASTTLGLLAATDTSTAGTPTTLTANVFPATGSGETGTVTFFENGVRIGASPVTNGQATLTAFEALAADVALTADYSGDANFTGSATPAPVAPGS
jgi:large repetitive protein